MGWQADIENSRHYKEYRRSAYEDSLKVIDELVLLDVRIEREHGVIYRSAEEIKDKLSIDVNEYPEFKNPYGCTNYGSLSTLVAKFVNMELTSVQTVLVRRLMRYAKVIHKRVQLVHELSCVTSRSTVTYWQYHRLCHKYYREMQSEILHGRAYKFASNLGIILINYLKESSLAKGFSLHVNWEKTHANKKLIESQGLPIYRNALYKRYADEGKADKYSGIKYMVYEHTDFMFQVVWSQCSIPNLSNYRYVSSGIGGNSYKDEILPHHTVEDIIHLECSVHAKLYNILKINPSYYNLFVRNRECHVYKYRRNYRKSFQ